MKYAVIICPGCGMAKGVETARKTTTCQCGRKVHVGRVKHHYMTDSHRELADAVALANEALRGGAKLPRRRRTSKDPYYAIGERAKSLTDPTQRIAQVAAGLAQLGAEFSILELRRVAGVVGRESAEEMLKRMKQTNLVYEVGEDRYRAV